jgi:RinA family phage transcriptional activator
LRKEIRRYIETELQDYENTKREYELVQQDIVNQSGTLDGQPRGTDISQPTERKAIKLVTNKRLAQLERTIKAIERVITNLPEEKFKLVRLKYWTSPQILTDEGIAQQIGCSRSTYYEWKDGILIALAKQMGLID